MPKLSMTIPHELEKEQAVERLKEGFGRIRETYRGQVKDLEETWNDSTLTFGFTTFGFKIKGSVAVEPSQVEMTGELPFAAMMFKGAIEQQVRDQIGKLLV